MPIAHRKTRVLIVDDSAAVRKALKDILLADPLMEVMGMASDPFAAALKIEREIPDVITLDIDMPRMDGITFLRKIMRQHPIPVVICSHFAHLSEEVTWKARGAGAVDVVEIPGTPVDQLPDEWKERFRMAVRKAFRRGEAKPLVPIPPVAPKLAPDVVLPWPREKGAIPVTEKVVVVGASTGGTEALRVFLEAMPLDSPPIVIAQHMPGNFTGSFAERLDALSNLSVKEAETGDVLVKGRALVAPGDRHTILKRDGGHYFVEVIDGPPVTRHRPSVDILFRSAAIWAGKNAIGIIMTGMGDDGARGMKEMRDGGAYTIAQDEKSCIVFGMPAEAIRLGGVEVVRPLDAIASAVMSYCIQKAPLELDNFLP